MDPDRLTDHLKAMALELGAVKVGVARRADLEGPPEADLDRVMPGATHAISLMAIEPEDLILAYLAKTDPKPYRDHFYDNIQLLGRIGLALADALAERGHRALALSPNGVYAPGSTIGHLLPPLSHRYVAHAAGIGAIGYSGNVMSPEHGTRIYLSTVVTDAPLVADGPLDENPCDDCKLCVAACPAQFMSGSERVAFTMGGREISHARKRSHAACAVSCGGFTGLSPDGTWSTLATSLRPVPEDDAEAERLFGEMLGKRLRYLGENPERPNFVRLSDPVDGYGPDNQGILARPRHDTHTTCGNCAIVCIETKKLRARALKTLRSSGVVVGERADGSPVVMGAADAAAYRAEHCEPYMDEGRTPAATA